MIDKKLWQDRAKELLDEIMLIRKGDLDGFMVVKIDHEGQAASTIMPGGPPEYRELLAARLKHALKEADAAGYLVISEVWFRAIPRGERTNSELMEEAQKFQEKSMRDDPEKQDAFLVIIGDEVGTDVHTYVIEEKSLRLLDTTGPNVHMGGRFVDLLTKSPTVN